MKLIDVYTHPETWDTLWQLLAERQPHQNISHKRMPSWEQHCGFIKSNPYLAWYAIDCGDLVGGVYLTRSREIGIGILRRFWGNAYGKTATIMLMEKHPGGPFYANVNPANGSSIRMFGDMGFKHLQSTYVLEMP